MSTIAQRLEVATHAGAYLDPPATIFTRALGTSSKICALTDCARLFDNALSAALLEVADA